MLSSNLELPVVMVIICLLLLSILCNGDDSSSILGGRRKHNLFTTSVDDTTPNYKNIKSSFGSNGLCVLGCTPYVDLTDRNAGVRKYRALVREMSSKCDVIVHLGDTKPGEMPCNRTIMTRSLHILRRAASKRGTLVLYTPGDNELNDCYQHTSSRDPIPSDINTAADARQWLIDDMKLSRPKDITGLYTVDNHKIDSNISGTNIPFSCDFDKYVEFDNYAIATIEVVGSDYYLSDSRFDGFPKQDQIDPLQDRLNMYLNANGCALDWIETATKRAVKSGGRIRALFFLFHATFYSDNGREPLASNNIGRYYREDKLTDFTDGVKNDKDGISKPYQPLFDKLTEVAFQNPSIMFYAVHSDSHQWTTIRMNPAINNVGGIDNVQTHHNLMIHQVEGSSRALTMYSKFTVDSTSFQPVALKQEWSYAAYKQVPEGHSWIPYKSEE